MVDTENNIIVVADYCQEEILSWTWTWTYLMVICRLYVCEPASSYGDLCRISRFSISYHMLVFWLRTRCLIRLSSGYVFPASFISTQMSRRECCVGKVMLPVCLRTWPVDSVPFHMRQILPGRPCWGAKATTVLLTHHGHTRAPSQCKDPLPQVLGFPC